MLCRVWALSTECSACVEHVQCSVRALCVPWLGRTRTYSFLDVLASRFRDSPRRYSLRPLVNGREGFCSVVTLCVNYSCESTVLVLVKDGTACAAALVAVGARLAREPPWPMDHCTIAAPCLNRRAPPHPRCSGLQTTV